MESTDADSGVSDLHEVTAVFRRVRETVNSILEPLQRVHDYEAGVIWYGLREERAPGETVPSEEDTKSATEMRQRTHAFLMRWIPLLRGLRLGLNAFVDHAEDPNFDPAYWFGPIITDILRFRDGNKEGNRYDVNTLMQGLDNLKHFVTDIYVSRINIANQSRRERQITFDVETLSNDLASLRRLLPGLADELYLARSQYDTPVGPSPDYGPGRQPDGHRLGYGVSARAYSRPALAVVVPRSLGVSYHLRRVRVLGGSLQARFR